MDLNPRSLPGLVGYYCVGKSGTGRDLLWRLYLFNLTRPVTFWRHSRAFFCWHEKDTLVGGFGRSPKIVKMKSGKMAAAFHGMKWMETK